MKTRLQMDWQRMWTKKGGDTDCCRIDRKSANLWWATHTDRVNPEKSKQTLRHLQGGKYKKPKLYHTLNSIINEWGKGSCTLLYFAIPNWTSFYYRAKGITNQCGIMPHTTDRRTWSKAGYTTMNKSVRWTEIPCRIHRADNTTVKPDCDGKVRNAGRRWYRLSPDLSEFFNF